MSRDYYGRHYDGQFVPLDCAIWTTPSGEEDIHDRVCREIEAERKKRYQALGPSGRSAYKTFHALCDVYSAHNENQARALCFWARRLKYCEEHGL